MPTPPTRQHGLGLLESLVALLVVCATMALFARHQAQLHAYAELVRQEAVALRLVQAELESLRAAPDPIEEGSRRWQVAAAHGAEVPFDLERSVGAGRAPGSQRLRVSAAWSDRHGAPRQMALDTILAAPGTLSSGALGLQRGTASAGLRGVDRSARVPASAIDLGDGRRAWKPVETGTVVLLFDPLTGHLVGRCDGVDAALATRALSLDRLGPCITLRGRLLTGVVRFTSALPPDPTHAVDLPLPFEIRLDLGRGHYPAPPACTTEPATGSGPDRYTAYHCLVLPRADGRWSGRSLLVPTGWPLGQAAPDRRVCRYVDDLDGNGSIDANAEHPADYVDVAENLLNQNFLVVAGSADCPGPTMPRAAPSPRNNGGTPQGTEPHQP